MCHLSNVLRTILAVAPGSTYVSEILVTKESLEVKVF